MYIYIYMYVCMYVYIYNLGYVNSVDEAHKLLAEFETGLTTKFSFCKADKGFGNTAVYIYI